MVKAGKPVDAVIDSLRPLLQPGDIVIDGIAPAESRTFAV